MQSRAILLVMSSPKHARAEIAFAKQNMAEMVERIARFDPSKITEHDRFRLMEYGPMLGKAARKLNRIIMAETI